MGLGSSVGRSLWVVGNLRRRLIRSSAPWRSLGSSGFTRTRPIGRRVHPCSLIRALGVVGFILVCLVHSRVRSMWRWVHSGSLGSLADAMGVVGFIRVLSSGSFASAIGVVVFIRGGSVNSRAFGWTLVSSGVFWFTRVRTRGWLGSSGVVVVTRVRGRDRCLWCAPSGSLGSSGIVGYTCRGPECCLESLRSLGSSLGSSGVVEFYRALGVVWYLFAFTYACPGIRWLSLTRAHIVVWLFPGR